LITPKNILGRLRASRNIYALSFLSLGSLIYSGAMPKVCDQCCSAPDYIIQSSQASSVADESARQEVGAEHNHADHHHSHSGRHAHNDKHTQVSSLAEAENDTELHDGNHADSGKSQSCVCDSCEPLPVSNLQFCGITSKRESDSPNYGVLQFRVISINSAELQLSLECALLRCHSPTPQLNSPTPFSGFGNQKLLC